MNRENILKVAEAIEKQSVPGLGFNMAMLRANGLPDYTGHHCKTVACVAGWVNAIAGDVSGDATDAAAYLEIPSHQLDDLFLPAGYNGEENYRFSPAAAVACLRHLAETGQVDWPRAIAATSPNGEQAQ